MSFSTLENTPVEIDLLVNGNTTGWSIDGTDAVHDSCNAGNIYLDGYTITTGHTYKITYEVVSISGGNVRAYMGTTAGALRTTAGFYEETLIAAGSSPEFYFYSNANVRLRTFDIKDTAQSTALKQQNNIVWSEKDNKWPSFHTYNPDCGFSLFTNLFVYKNGELWRHGVDIGTRNNYFGVQYQSILQFTSNIQPGQPKTFEAISYEGNQLMITTTDGIETSLGQISELIEADFLKDTLADGVSTVLVYDKEGVYSAGFMRDKNVDIINGDALKGSYITIELITLETGALKLKNVAVHSEPSRIGAR